MGLKTDLVESRNALDAKRKKLSDVFEQAGPDLDMDKVKVLEGDSAAKAAAIRALHEEINADSQKVDELAATLKAKEAIDRQESGGEGEKSGKLPHPQEGKGGGYHPAVSKSIGELFIESAAFKSFKGSGDSPVAELDINLKTLMETGAGWEPETTRTGRLIDIVTRPIQVVDTIPQGSTTQTSVVYMTESTFTNNAAETAEGGLYGEAALALTETSDPVRKITVWLPVTDEQLADVPQVSGYVNNRLPFMLRQRLDGQILNGNGTAPNLRGILNRSGIQSQIKGADPAPDAIYKAMTKVRLSGSGNGGAFPNSIYMHPNDWQNIRLLRTADGIYIWGSPAEPGMDRIWGLPVVQAEALTELTALVGDTNFVELAVRTGIDVQVSNSHSDFFVNGKQAIRADMRAALVVYRAAAFCSVDLT